MRGLPTLRRPAAAAAALAVLASVLVGSAPGASAAGSQTFVVNDSGDAVDLTLDGVCATAGGTCTLRAAVQEADNLAGTTDVNFDPTVAAAGLSLSGPGGPEEGDLDVNPGTTLRVFGNVPAPGNATVVKAGSLGDRIFDVAAGGHLALVDVSLLNGSSDENGGAIRNSGEVLIANRPTDSGTVVAVDSSAATGLGGAIYNAKGAELTIADVSTATDSSGVMIAHNKAGMGGGGIANDGGTVKLFGTEVGAAVHAVYIDDNSTPGDGGGVLNLAGGGSVDLACRSFVRYGKAKRGGNVFNAAGLTVTDTTIDTGFADADGGGLFNDTTGTVTAGNDDTCPAPGSSVFSSAATNAGGGIYNRGGISVPNGSWLSINHFGGGDMAATGGGLFQESGTIQVDGELQVDGPSASGAGGGIAMTGGQLFTSDSGTVWVRRTHSHGDGGGLSVSGGSVAGQFAMEFNDTTEGGGAIGVSGSADVALWDSFMIANTAGTRGGGVLVSGGNARLRNTTISGNHTSDGGRGTVEGAAAAVEGGSLTLRYTTIADNYTDGAWSGVAGQPVLQRTLMARNGTNCTGTAPATNDYNVFDDGSCLPSGTDLTDGSRFAAVGSLLDADVDDNDPYSYGLQFGNPAIDFVTDKGCNDPDRDQVGNGRPKDGDGINGPACDAGAIEAPYGGVLRTLSGTVRHETDGSPMAGVCVYTGLTDGGGDGKGVMALTDADGHWSSAVPEGTFLIAFFMPKSAASVKDCGESGFDMAYQPEWYRNVPVEFKNGGDEPKMPDLGTITLVTVAGGDTSGIDACLGAGPTAGLDAPCVAAAAPVEQPATTTTTTPTTSTTTTTAPATTTTVVAAAYRSTGQSGSTGTRSGTRLAYTGSSGAGAAPVALLLLGVGLLLVAVTNRRRAGLT